MNSLIDILNLLNYTFFVKQKSEYYEYNYEFNPLIEQLFTFHLKTNEFIKKR